jgi:hypothetical protein
LKALKPIPTLKIKNAKQRFFTDPFAQDLIKKGPFRDGKKICELNKTGVGRGI